MILLHKIIDHFDMITKVQRKGTRIIVLGLIEGVEYQIQEETENVEVAQELSEKLTYFIGVK